MSKPAAGAVFRDSDSLKVNVKGSLFEKLLPVRKGLFEKFPCASKGLVFSGPGIKLGQKGIFSFTTTEKSDKVEFKECDGVNLCARYKKESKLFDVTANWKCTCVPGFSGLLKYEERSQESPTYVVGACYSDKKSGLHCSLKVNPLTTQTKVALLHEGATFGLPNGFRLAADSKLFFNKILSPEHILFNVGLCYKNPLGHTGIAYNQHGMVTVTHVHQKDDLQLAIEVVHPVVGKKNAQVPLVLAASYQVDKTTLVRAKVNTDFVFSLGVKKDFHSNLNVSAGTNVDLQKIAVRLPSFGFKVSMKA